MKIFLIKFNKCNYDQYGGFVIVAKDVSKVLKKIANDEDKNYLINWKSGYVISEINPKNYKKATVILEDFNAG